MRDSKIIYFRITHFLWSKIKGKDVIVLFYVSKLFYLCFYPENLAQVLHVALILCILKALRVERELNINLDSIVVGDRHHEFHTKSYEPTPVSNMPIVYVATQRN